MLPFINTYDHFSGATNAKIILEVYEDFECEDSGRAFRELKKLTAFFNDNICTVYKQFPLFNIHPSAFLAALIVEEGARQKKFEQVRDLIFENQEYMEYGLAGILQLLTKRNIIAADKLVEDKITNDEELKMKINDDIKSGLQKKVKNTPAIFINNYMYRGKIRFEDLSRTIKRKMEKIISLQTNKQHENVKLQAFNFKSQHLLEWNMR